tara:strand:- start:2948 stop:3145 length:198 start_codon:yes stop_codon:yes gene_type:complete
MKTKLEQLKAELAKTSAAWPETVRAEAIRAAWTEAIRTEAIRAEAVVERIKAEIEALEKEQENGC